MKPKSNQKHSKKKQSKKKPVPHTGPMKPLPKPDTGCVNGQLFMLFNQNE